jgi:hypothetical protein
MASDWFIYFEGDAVGPTVDELGSVLRNFFGEGTTTKIEWVADQSRWYVNLPGKPSHPYADFIDTEGRHRDDERWIEVWRDKDDGTVDVMTRMQDRYTNVLADGLARVIAQYWKGRLEDD